MRLILIGVGRIYHEQELILFKPVQIRVVYCAPILIGYYAILRLVKLKAGNVAGEHMLQKLQPFSPLYKQPAHMGYVKKAACMARVQMLSDYAAWVLHGHFPPAKVHHACARRNVRIVKLCPFKFAHDSPPQILIGVLGSCAGFDKQKRHKIPL